MPVPAAPAAPWWAGGWSFAKGHGTANDFVVLPDPDGRVDLTPGLVRALCDRRRGVGGDGVLRVVRCAAEPAAADLAAPGVEWFMDYRNADGSAAQMCGNGARVFARYLVGAGLAPPGSVRFATRGGVRTARLGESGDVAVDMGRASRGEGPVRVRAGGGAWAAAAVHVPNPHAVAFVSDPAEAGDLAAAPVVEPAAAFPEGVNVEFVAVRGPDHLALRVHERGVGETASCGTGVCAAAWAARHGGPLGAGPTRHGGPGDGSDPGPAPPAPEPVGTRVDVPGGTLHVAEHPDGRLELTGPAELVASGRLAAAWLASRAG